MIRMDPNADLLIEWNIRLRSNRCGEVTSSRQEVPQAESFPPTRNTEIAAWSESLSAGRPNAVRNGRPR